MGLLDNPPLSGGKGIDLAAKVDTIEGRVSRDRCCASAIFSLLGK
jgi:hypothetical protein